MHWAETRKVTVVSWAHKEKRFRYHGDTIKLPENRFRFEGPNKLPATGKELKKAMGEEEATLKRFHEDPWGITGELSQKRKERK